MNNFDFLNPLNSNQLISMDKYFIESKLNNFSARNNKYYFILNII